MAKRRGTERLGGPFMGCNVQLKVHVSHQDSKRTTQRELSLLGKVTREAVVVAPNSEQKNKKGRAGCGLDACKAGLLYLVFHWTSIP